MLTLQMYVGDLGEGAGRWYRLPGLRGDRPDPPDAPPAGERARKSGLPRNPDNSAIILLVEDNEDDILLTLRALARNGVTPEDVTVVRDGQAALDYLAARGPYAGHDPSYLPHLILLDVRLPKLSGHEVLTQLRRDARTKLIPVVMLTSSRDESDILEGYNLGANSYVQKPVDSQAFDETIQGIAAYWLGLNESPFKPHS